MNTWRPFVLCLLTLIAVACGLGIESDAEPPAAPRPAGHRDEGSLGSSAALRAASLQLQQQGAGPEYALVAGGAGDIVARGRCEGQGFDVTLRSWGPELACDDG